MILGAIAGVFFFALGVIVSNKTQQPTYEIRKQKIKGPNGTINTTIPTKRKKKRKLISFRKRSK